MFAIEDARRLSAMLHQEVEDWKADQWKVHGTKPRMDSIQWTTAQMEIDRLQRELDALKTAMNRRLSREEYPVFGD